MNQEQKLAAAKEAYGKFGVDVFDAMEAAGQIPVSIHCWQGDDVKGFDSDTALSGGIAAIGNYPGAARTPAELRQDISKAFSLIPGKKKLNLHALYAETGGKKVDRNELLPEYFTNWVDYAKELGIGLDFNPSFFSHKLSDDGFTLSHADRGIRQFWIDHGIVSRRISAYFGKELGIPSVNNVWIPDGYKDMPVDRKAPRRRLNEALDAMFEEKIDTAYNLDAVECKLFGLGSEAYVVGSHEFYMGYAQKNDKLLTLDTGHFHPTEQVSNKISAVLEFIGSILLHVSRPMRWDSDHVVIFDDELREIALEIIRGGYLDRVFIGLDFFDASINRIAAWAIGARNMQKALLYALLEPTDMLRRIELEGNYTKRLALLEELKAMPWQLVWDYYCESQGVPVGAGWIAEAESYEKNVLAKR